MADRQQRTSGVRRVRPNFLGNQYAVVPWKLEQVDAFTLNLGPILEDGSFWPATQGVAVQAYLPLLCQTLPELPSAVSWDGIKFQLSYTTILPIPAVFFLPPNSEAWRGPRGEYLAPGRVTFDAVTPGPVDSTVNRVEASAGNAAIMLNEAADVVYWNQANLVRNDTTAEFGIGVNSAAGLILYSFVTPVVAGNQITVNTSVNDWHNQTLGGLVGGTFNVL